MFFKKSIFSGSLKHGIILLRINPFQNKPRFLRVGSTTQNEQFLLFPTVFSTLLNNSLPFSSNLKLSSANSFSLEESEICRLGKSSPFFQCKYISTTSIEWLTLYDSNRKSERLSYSMLDYSIGSRITLHIPCCLILIYVLHVNFFFFWPASLKGCTPFLPVRRTDYFYPIYIRLFELFKWCFTQLSTVFPSYHGDSSHYSCLSWVSAVIGWGSKVSCPRTFPRTRGP